MDDAAQNLPVTRAAEGSSASLTVARDSVIVNRLLTRLPISKPWFLGILGALMLLMPILCALADGIDPVLLWRYYRAQFVYALLLVYLIGAVLHVLKSRTKVAIALREVIAVDDGTYAEVVDSSCRVSSTAEILAFVIGTLMGLTINLLFEPIDSEYYYLERYAYASRLLIFGAVTWAVFIIYATTRMSRTLLKLPTRVNIFDLRPFEPIGRQSLQLALVLLGGLLISLLSANYEDRTLWIQYLFNYGVIIAATLLVFILNTLPTHRLLNTVKGEEVTRVEVQIAQTYARLQGDLNGGQIDPSVGAELNALSIALRLVKGTRTWPYNTETLRTLTIAVIAPLFVGLARIAAVLVGA